MTRALGLDLGSKRIGIALSSGSVATPYEVQPRTGDRVVDHRRIAAHVVETEATLVVVGLPLSLDGSIGAAARKILDEIDELRSRLAVPIETWDERFTTTTAHRVLREMDLNAQARRRVVDKVAAAVILQGWLDARATTTNSEEPS